MDQLSTSLLRLGRVSDDLDALTSRRDAARIAGRLLHDLDFEQLILREEAQGLCLTLSRIFRDRDSGGDYSRAVHYAGLAAHHESILDTLRERMNRRAV